MGRDALTLVLLWLTVLRGQERCREPERDADATPLASDWTIGRKQQFPFLGVENGYRWHLKKKQKKQQQKKTITKNFIYGALPPPAYVS